MHHNLSVLLLTYILIVYRPWAILRGEGNIINNASVNTLLSPSAPCFSVGCIGGVKLLDYRIHFVQHHKCCLAKEAHTKAHHHYITQDLKIRRES